MTAKEYLREIRKYRNSKRRLQRKIKELNEDLYTIGGFDYSRDRVQNDTPKDLISDKVMRLIDLQRKYERSVIVYNEELALRENQIMSLDKESHREILGAIYLDYMSLKDAAYELGYSYHRACHIHGDALQVFAKKYLV